MRKLFVVAVAFALCAGAYADIDHFIDCWYQADVAPGSDVLVPDFNDGTYYTIDLWVNVTNGDDWTSSAGRATIDSGVFFYDHPLSEGDETPNSAALGDIYASLPYESFFSATEASAANNPPYKDPSFAEVDVGPQYRNAVWFDTPPNGGEGELLIARYTIHAQDAELPVTFYVEGESTTYDGGGTLYPYEFTCVIPEPASLALVGLGLALIRRR